MLLKWTENCVVVVVIVICVGRGECYEGNVTLSRLMHGLFLNYDKEMRPVRNNSDIVTVEFGMALRAVINIEETDQTLTSSVWVRQYWTDAFLKWDPALFDGIQNIQFPAENMWKPDTVLYNNAHEKFSPMYTNIIADVDYTGRVTYLFPAVFVTSCNLDIRYFPFDQQICSLKFGSWMYDGLKVDFVEKTHAADTSDYVYNSAWGLVSMSSRRNVEYYGCCPGPFPDIELHITLRRRYQLYVFYLIFPTVLVSILTSLQFFLPCDCGERVSLGITILLALSVFLLLIADILPASEFIPLIGAYFGCSMVFVTISILITFFILHLHHNGSHDNNTEVPHWVRKVFLHWLATGLCMAKQITTDVEHHIKMQAAAEGSHLYLTQLASRSKCNLSLPKTQSSHSGKVSVNMRTAESILQKILDGVDEMKNREAEKLHNAEIKSEWQQVAMVIDRLLLWIFSLSFVIYSFAIIMNRPFYHGDIIL